MRCVVALLCVWQAAARGLPVISEAELFGIIVGHDAACRVRNVARSDPQGTRDTQRAPLQNEQGTGVSSTYRAAHAS